jgi:hypothetical protein
MNAHPLVGTRVPKDVLVDVDRLRREYRSREPDFGVSSQRVRFGISGHRGSSLRDAFNEAHIVVDPLGGASVGFRAPIGALYRIDIYVVNDTVDPTFGFMPLDWNGRVGMDCSSPYAMAPLVGLKDRFDIAPGNDPDTLTRELRARSTRLRERSRGSLVTPTGARCRTKLSKPGADARRTSQPHNRLSIIGRSATARPLWASTPRP